MKNVRKTGIFSANHSGRYIHVPPQKKFGISYFPPVFVSAQIEMVPQNYQPLNEEQAVMMQKLIDTMEDDDDVQNVWHNWEE